MRQLDLLLVEARRVDREAVIVRSDFDLLRQLVLDRLIAAPVAEFQFEGLAAEGETSGDDDIEK